MKRVLIAVCLMSVTGLSAMQLGANNNAGIGVGYYQAQNNCLICQHNAMTAWVDMPAVCPGHPVPPADQNQNHDDVVITIPADQTPLGKSK